MSKTTTTKGAHRSLRFDPELFRALEKEADQEGHTFSSWIRHLLKTHPKRQKASKK